MNRRKCAVCSIWVRTECLQTGWICLQNLNKNKISELSISPNIEGSTYNITGKLKSYKTGETFYVVTPLSDDTLNYINKMQEKNKFKLTVGADPSSSLLAKFLDFVPYLLLAGILCVAMICTAIFKIMTGDEGEYRKYQARIKHGMIALILVISILLML